MSRNATAGSFKPGDKRAGRPKGTPNKATADVRAAIAMLVQNNVDSLEGWLKRVARKNPAKAADIFLRTVEYHIPKLHRSEVTGLGGGPVQTVGIVTTDPAEAARAYQDIIKGA